jgi:hypothetical protein
MRPSSLFCYYLWYASQPTVRISLHLFYSNLFLIFVCWFVPLLICSFFIVATFRALDSWCLLLLILLILLHFNFLFVLFIYIYIFILFWSFIENMNFSCSEWFMINKEVAVFIIIWTFWVKLLLSSCLAKFLLWIYVLLEVTLY